MPEVAAGLLPVLQYDLFVSRRIHFGGAVAMSAWPISVRIVDEFIETPSGRDCRLGDVQTAGVPVKYGSSELLAFATT